MRLETLGTEPRTSYMQRMRSTTELHPQLRIDSMSLCPELHFLAYRNVAKAFDKLFSSGHDTHLCSNWPKFFQAHLSVFTTLVTTKLAALRGTVLSAKKVKCGAENCFERY